MNEKPYISMRRADRAMDDEWNRSFLRQAPFCSIATVHNGRPFITTNTFVYDEGRHAIFLHTARTGRLRTNIDADPNICLTAAGMGRLLPAETAKEFSVEFASVVVFGRMTVLRDPQEALDAMQMLLDKYFPHLESAKDYRPITPQEIMEISAYRVDILEWSGKCKQAADTPGAFYFGEKPASQV